MNSLMRRAERDLWDPFDFVTDFQHEMNRLFGRTLQKKNGYMRGFEPEIDLSEDKDNFVVKADLPGIKKEELDIKVEGRVLTVKGERKEEKETKEKSYFSSERFYGAFTRMIELPAEVKADQVKASYKDGVLEIMLPKAEGAKAKHITVEVK